MVLPHILFTCPAHSQALPPTNWGGGGWVWRLQLNLEHTRPCYPVCAKIHIDPAFGSDTIETCCLEIVLNSYNLLILSEIEEGFRSCRLISISDQYYFFLHIGCIRFAFVGYDRFGLSIIEWKTVSISINKKKDNEMGIMMNIIKWSTHWNFLGIFLKETQTVLYSSISFIVCVIVVFFVWIVSVLLVFSFSSQATLVSKYVISSDVNSHELYYDLSFFW